MSDSSTLVGNSRPWGGQVTGDCGPYTERQWHIIYKTLFDGSEERGPLLNWGGEFQVTERGAGANMSVDIADGAAIIDGLWAYSGSTVNLTVSASDAVQDRYDLVFAYWDSVTQTTQLRIEDGVLGGGACESVTNYQTANVEWAIPLACVYVAATVVAINNADITDLREFCRYRFSPESIVDGTHITTDANHLLTIAADGVGVDEINAAIAGDGLVQAAGGELDVNPDGVTLEINADAIRIAAGAAGNGLGGGGGAALSVNVDAATITIVGDTLQVGTIDNSHITNRTRSCFIGANALYASTGNPPVWGAIGAQPVPAEGWMCQTGVDDYVIGHWRVPADFVAGNVTVYIIWTHVAAANQICRLRLDYINAMGCGGSLVGGTTSITQDTAANLADANKRMCTQLTTTIAMAADEYLDFFVGRNGAHGNDTLAVDMTLLGVEFQYTADM